MSQLEMGQRVRSLVDLIAPDGSLLPAGTVGTVVAFQGERVVVAVHDLETDTKHTVTGEVWEWRRT